MDMVYSGNSKRQRLLDIKSGFCYTEHPKRRQLMNLHDEIIEMSDAELREYVEQKSEEMGIKFDFDMLDEKNRRGLLDFIADYIHPELQSELHSECQLTPGNCSMFPDAETLEDIEEELEHWR